MNELKQLAIQSLRQYQRQELEPSNQQSTANDVLQHILERTKQSTTDSEDFSAIQTSLIDAWTTHQSSVIRDIKEANAYVSGLQ